MSSTGPDPFLTVIKQCCGSGRIGNILPDPDLDPGPADPDPYPFQLNVKLNYT
jgi:hypothetical protein